MNLEYNAIIAGCARNVACYLERTLAIFDRIGQKFAEYVVIVYENDSTDETRRLLQAMKKPHYIYVMEDNVATVIPERTERLAGGRNKILDVARRLVVQERFNFLIMADMDNILASGKIVETIETCFQYQDWEVMTANQSRQYYDIWAYREKGVLETDCWNDVANDVARGVRREEAVARHVDAFAAPKPQGALIPVESAFGGIAVYRLPFILSCRYEGMQKAPSRPGGMIPICEHVPFHQCIRKKGGRIFVNPAMLTD